MKAVLFTSYGLPDGLHVMEIPTPKIEADKVIIHVNSCDIHFQDVLISEGDNSSV